MKKIGIKPCILLLLFLLCGIFSACDIGLSPPADLGQTRLVGAVRFVGGVKAWPPADSVRDLRVVGFKQFPPKDLIGEITSGTAFFTPETLPLFKDSLEYSIDLPAVPPSELQYIAIVQLFGADIFKDWRVVGVYTVSGDNTKASVLTIRQGIDNRADLRVDFKNLPPQPF